MVLSLRQERGNILPAPPPEGLNFLTREIADYVDWWLASEAQVDAMVDKISTSAQYAFQPAIMLQPLCTLRQRI